MALPSDPAESFVREVDENLRRDQMAEMAKTHGKWIIAAALLFLAAVGGYLYWRNQQQKQAAVHSETLSGALDKIGEGDAKAGAAELAPLGDSSNDVTRASSLLGQAAMALRQNDRKRAIELYRKVAGDDGLPDAYRDLATVRLTMTEFDQLKPDEVIARLKPLTEAGKPYFGSAGELTAMAMLAKGDRAGAGQLFAQIAADRQVPDTIRSRAVQFAGTLGVDASALMPAAAGGAPLPAQ
ncbi:MAG TPA: tetratricopeptide repeat protein [Sphingomicrobium sp.]|nr:tetratricopeptide repeat protein [Sphingomicrobium sp.]